MQPGNRFGRGQQMGAKRERTRGGFLRVFGIYRDSFCGHNVHLKGEIVPAP
jgi:hypothetical protein